MALSWAQVSNIIKAQYLPTMVEVINTEDFIGKYVEKNNQVEHIQVGQNFTKSFGYGLSEGTAMMNDVTSALEAPGQRSFKTFTGNPKIRDGVIKIYEMIAEYMNTDEKAFIDELTSETEGLSDAMKCEKERMNYGDGGVTPLAIVVSATDASPSVITLAASSTKYLRPGMKIDFLTSTKAAIANGNALEIKDITGDNSFTVDLVVTGTTRANLVTALAGAYIYHKGGYNNEFNGLGSLFGSTTNTVLGVDRSTAAGAWYRPNVYRTNSDGTITLGAKVGTPQAPGLVALKGVISRLTTQKKANKKNLYAFAPEGVADEIVSLAVNNNQYITPAKSIDGWPYEVVSFNNVPILCGNFSPDNTMYIVDMSGMVQFLAKKLGFSEMDGNMWKWVNGFAAYTAYCLEAYEYGHFSPWKCATIYDMKAAY